MTTIAAATDGSTFALAADGRSMWGEQIVADRYVKIRAWPGEDSPAVAIAGETRICNIIDDLVTTTEMPAGPRDYADRLRAEMDRLNWRLHDREAGGHPNYGFQGVYLSSAGVWYVACDFTVVELTPDYPRAFGSGSDFASGAMAALRMAVPKYTPEELVWRGVGAAHRDNRTGGGTMLAVRGARCRGPE